ncbi:hypothetical protein [Streptomyces silvisoli]|uniref:MFS transporter n=1 Tax=Streptomyces silvisoli TaxID=3034235 RepID=A0ABT5ZR35_9ACTN|nr:hypothetical protein [Streptomyces silvisoli]MDF3292290.1 hypothetical protein [Streptomyces silvisoli]
MGGVAGVSVLAAARAAFDSALTTTAYVSAGIVLAAAVLATVLVPRGFTVTAAH